MGNTEVSAVKVGDIFETINGYDCTYFNFYQVLEVSKTGKTFKVQGISKSRTPTNWGYKTKPVKDTFHGEVYRATFTKYGPRSGFGRSYSQTLRPYEGGEKDEAER